MKKPKKIMIAGVGGLGVVYLTNLITEAAVVADIPVASSEIHGLAQRRGSVIAGITLGENTYGYIENAGADYLIGLEPLEAQRCIGFLNKNSRVIIDDNQIFPHSVNTGNVAYPDVTAFIDYLKENIAQVILNQDYHPELNPILRNVYILGRASTLEGFPIPFDSIEEALIKVAKAKHREASLMVLKLGKGK
ncbi:MAG: 2-oxoacid:acceptor oxidoreductase family protein [Candidatus Electryoneaceae bacterium]|nr:2-oxoacid:acceptor oxidoreductase family protein [Candidatus Electryoneaceae bacterium]